MFFVFFAVWLIFNGVITVETVIFGLLISAGMCCFMNKFMGYSPRREFINIRLALLMVKYIAILLWEIVKANISVIGLITSSRNELEPAVVKFDTDLNSQFARVLLANSITLTPGTITASLEGNAYEVHCLDKSLAVDLDESVFVKQLRHIEEVGGMKSC